MFYWESEAPPMTIILILLKHNFSEKVFVEYNIMPLFFPYLMVLSA